VLTTGAPGVTHCGKTTFFRPLLKLGQARSSFNSVEAIVDWSVQDGGVALMYAYQAAHHIADGALEIILSDYEVEPLPVYFIYPQGGHRPRKVRAFIDYATSRLRKRLADIEAQCSS
jgi:DNA-binding transcriptional LysR family regulator